jgi:hypothetical protein
MATITKIGRVRISTKLSSTVGAALVALCAMGVIAVFAAREIRDLGHDLYAENDQFSTMQMRVSLDVERAIGEVHSAASELDLDALKAKRERLQTLLGDAARTLKETRDDRATAEVAAGRDAVVTSIAALEGASKKVFDFARSFAQPDAIEALKGLSPNNCFIRLVAWGRRYNSTHRGIWRVGC